MWEPAGKKEQGSEYRLTDLALKYVFDKQVTSGVSIELRVSKSCVLSSQTFS